MPTMLFVSQLVNVKVIMGKSYFPYDAAKLCEYALALFQCLPLFSKACNKCKYSFCMLEFAPCLARGF